MIEKSETLLLLLSRVDGETTNYAYIHIYMHEPSQHTMIPNVIGDA